MTGCSAPNCSNQSTDKRMFRFPRNAERRKQWLVNCRRDDWSPTDNSRFCEDHFEPMEFEPRRADGKKLLRKDAEPTIFNVSNPPPLKRRVFKLEVDGTQCTAEMNAATADHLYVKTEMDESSDVENIYVQRKSGDKRKNDHPYYSPLDCANWTNKRESRPRKICVPESRIWTESVQKKSGTKNSKGSQTVGQSIADNFPQYSENSIGNSNVDLANDDSSDRLASVENCEHLTIDIDIISNPHCVLNNEQTSRTVSHNSMERSCAQTLCSIPVQYELQTATNSPDGVSKDQEHELASDDGQSANKETVNFYKRKVKNMEYRLWRTQALLAASRKENRNLKAALHFLKPDQIEKMCRKKAGKWSADTLRASYQLRFSCGKKGYEVLLKQGFPLPSDRTLCRRFERAGFVKNLVPELVYN